MEKRKGRAKKINEFDKNRRTAKRKLKKRKQKVPYKKSGAKRSTADSILRPWCRFKISDRPSGYLKQPKGPHPGAMLTVRQIVGQASFTTKAGTAVSAGNLQSLTSDSFFAYAFGLQDMGDTSSYSSIFDQYRFEKIKLHFTSACNTVMINNQVSGGTTVTTAPAMPLMYLVTDFDDAAVLGSVAAAREFGTCHVLRTEDCVTVEFTPTYNLDSESQVGAAMRLSGDWLDMAEPDVPHYGCKGVLTNHLSGNQPAQWTVEAEYVVSFNNSR